MFTIFESDQISARIDEYSEMNIRFHQAIIGLSRCDLLAQIAENLFIHMRAIRVKTISENNRANRSIIDHMNIIHALERRDTELAEQLVRQHALDLAAHEIGRAHVCTPVTNAPLVCRSLLETKKKNKK